jgi:hypothetical protein
MNRRNRSQRRKRQFWAGGICPNVQRASVVRADGEREGSALDQKGKKMIKAMSF